MKIITDICAKVKSFFTNSSCCSSKKVAIKPATKSGKAPAKRRGRKKSR